MRKIIYFAGYVILFLIISYMQWLNVETGILHTGDMFLGKIYLILSTAMLVLIIFSIISLRTAKISLIKIYPVVMLILGFGYMYVFPAMSAPDEIAHFISAYKLSNEILGEQAEVSDGHVIIRASDIWLEDTNNEYMYDTEKSIKEGVLIPKGGSYGKVIGSKLEEVSYKVFFREGIGFNTDNNISFEGKDYRKAQSLHSPVNTVFSVYLPAACGISLARILKLNTVGLVIFGRLANLTVFTVFGMLSIYFLPDKFKDFIFLVSLLPMTLELAASYSYDAIMISGIMFFVSYVFHLIHSKNSFNIKDLTITSMISGLLFPCKIVYIPLLLLLFGIPIHKFVLRGESTGEIKKENIIFFTTSALTVLLSLVITMYFVNKVALVNYSTGNTGSLDWAGEESYTISYLIHNRIKSARIFYNTVLLQLEYYHQTMFGFYLGHADEVIGIPYIGFLIFNIGIFISTFGNGEDILLSKKEKILSILSISCAIFLVLLSMLIAWTPISSDFIEGVSGRYFLPMLLPLLLVLKNNKFIIKCDVKRSIIFVFIFINALSLLKIFSTVCIRL